MYQLYIGYVNESTILQTVNREDHELSWILPTALCNVLKLSIILFTKLPHFPVIPVLAADLHLKEKSSYIYIRHFGKLKFDTLGQRKYQTLSPPDENYVPTSKKANLYYQPKTSSSLQYQRDNIFCRCGRGREESDANKERCVSKKYPCNKSSLGCKSSCDCYNCKNRFEIHEIVVKVGQTKRRERVKQSSQVQRSTSRNFILKKAEKVVATGWTYTEHFYTRTIVVIF